MTYSPTKVSIVIPVEKGAKGFRKTVESCRFQSYKELDIVVVLGSSEHTERAYQIADDDRRVRIIQSKDSTVNELITIGCDYSYGHFLTVLPCGDSQEHNRIEKQVEYGVSLTNIFYDDCVGPQARIKYLTQEGFAANPSRDNLETLMIDVEIYSLVGGLDHEDEHMYKNWFGRYFAEVGTKIPIIRERLYRKERNVK